jgi:hypothetical protein
VAYDFLVWLFGGGITTLIAFLPIQLSFHDHELLIETMLSKPITNQTRTLVSKGFIFGIQFDCTIIINDVKTFERTTFNTVSFQKSQWNINGRQVEQKRLQEIEGTIRFTFDRFTFGEGDEMAVYIKASIAPDSVFTQSTGLKTSILWNYYEPRCEKKYVFKKGIFVLK